MRRKNRLNFFLAAFLFIAGIGLGYFLGVKSGDRIDSATARNSAAYTEPQVPTPSSTPTSTYYKDNAYLIKNYDGLIGVYKIENDSEHILEYVINTSILSLRADDQERLNEGIRVSSRDEMIKIVEDFSN